MPSELNAPMEDVERAASFVAELADVQRWYLPMRRETRSRTIMGCDTICFMETCIRCAPLIKLLSLAQNEHALVGEHEFMTHFNAIMQHENHDGLLSLINETHLATMLGMAMATRGTDGVVVHNERIYWRVGIQRFGWWIHEDQKQFARITIRNVLMMPRASSPSPTLLSFLTSISDRSGSVESG